MWMIPQLPRTDGATLWFGAFVPTPPEVVWVEVIDVGGRRRLGRRALRPRWAPVEADATPRVWTGRASIDGLAPDRLYRLQLADESGAPIDAASELRTLPLRVPGASENPLTILLGSCFDYSGDGGAAISSFRRLLTAAQFPHLKVLCGDQIYLDLPVSEVIPRDPALTYRHILGKYLRNWAPGGTRLASGYGDLLRRGANLLVSDDHEYWNNYPFAASHVPFTYTAARRALLTRLGTAFCRAFQAEMGEGDGVRALTEIVIGPEGACPGDRLEILAIDGRIERTFTRAHWPADMERLCARLRGLTSPALVVLSQPLFQPAEGAIRRRWVDAGIADFDDYEPLAAALAAAPHDVMILSGDIHCGRIAETSLPGGRRIVEVVASPLSLIPRTSYEEKPADTSFPARPLSPPFRIPSSEIRMRRDPIREDHAVTLAIRARGRSVAVEVSFWSVRTRERIGAAKTFTLT